MDQMGTFVAEAAATQQKQLDAVMADASALRERGEADATRLQDQVGGGGLQSEELEGGVHCTKVGSSKPLQHLCRCHGLDQDSEQTRFSA